MNKLKLILLTLLPTVAFGQGLEFFNGGEAIYVQKGSMITVQGEFVNGTDSTNGIVINDGIIDLQGNFENKGNSIFTYADTSSKDRVVKFTGNGTQTIKGNMNNPTTASFYNMVVDKTNAASNVEMQTPVSVTGSLVFGTASATSTYTPSVTYTATHNKGFLKTYSGVNEYVLTMHNGSTDAIAGYPAMVIDGNPATAYILTAGTRGSANGGLQRNITTATGYDFPIGTTTHGFNATRMNFTNIPSGGGFVMGKFNDGSDNTNGVVGKLSTVCIGCDVNNPTPDNNGYNRYFTINPCNNNLGQWVTLQDGIKDHGYWSFAANGNDQAYNYSIETFPNTFNMLGSYTNAWRTLKYGADYGTNPTTATTDWSAAIDSVENTNDLVSFTLNTGSCYTGNGVPGGSYRGFGHFTTRLGNTGNALPVEMIYVRAESKTNTIDVKWATALEINNQGFEVMRSTDGVNFNTIGWVSGHNNSTTQNDYVYTDNNVMPNTVYYYQLNQLDNNGDHDLSQIVTGMVNGGGVAGITIGEPVPNPAISLSAISVNTGVSGEMFVKLVNMVGQVVAEQTIGLNAGTNSVTLNVQNLASGSYSAVLNMGDISVSKIIVVTK